MENKSEETLKTEQQNESQSLDRPKSFIMRRRKEVFYFSEDSTRGILKRVPVKNDIFYLTEMETVLEKPGAAKTRKEICSGFSFNRPGSSKVNQSSSASKTDNVCKSAYHERKRDVFKSCEKVDGYMQPSQSLGAQENDFKAKDEYRDPKMVGNKTRKDIFSKVLLNRPGISKVNQNFSASKNDNDCKPAYHEQKQDIGLKNRGNFDGFMQQPGICKKDLKAKEYRDLMINDQQTQKKNMFLKLYKEIKRQQPKDEDVGIYRDLYGSKSDEKHTMFIASSLKNCSTKKPVENRSNNSLYSDSWPEKYLNDDLSKMSMKTDYYQDPLVVDIKKQKGFCSAVPLNRLGSSNVIQNSSASEIDTACTPFNYEKNGEIILKSHAKVDEYMKLSQNMGAHKKDLKAKEEHLDPMMHGNTVGKKNIFSKPCEEIKIQQSKDGDVSFSKEFHGPKSDGISTSSLKNCSPKKKVEIKTNNSLYSDKRYEKYLSDDLNNKSVKTTFITEL